MLSLNLGDVWFPATFRHATHAAATETTVKQIEDAFKEFTAREDIAIVLISQYVSEPSHTHAYICVLMHC